MAAHPTGLANRNAGAYAGGMATAPTQPDPAPRADAILPSLLAITAGVLFGGAVVATRYVVQQSDPLTIVTLRYVIGFSVMAPLYVTSRRQMAELRRMWGRDLLAVTGLGVLFFGLIPLSFTVGLSMTHASRGGLVLALAPLATLLLSALLRVEALTAGKLGGAACAVLGAALALGAGVVTSGVMAGGAGSGGAVPAATLLRGDAFMLLTTLLFAIYNVRVHRYLRAYHPLTVILHSLFSGTVFLLGSYVLLRGALPWARLDATGWAALLFIGIPGGAVGFAMYIMALGGLSPARAAVYYNLNPITAVALGALLLGEPLGLHFWAGFALVLGGILLAQRERLRGA